MILTRLICQLLASLSTVEMQRPQSSLKRERNHLSPTQIRFVHVSAC